MILSSFLQAKQIEHTNRQSTQTAWKFITCSKTVRINYALFNYLLQNDINVAANKTGNLFAVGRLHVVIRILIVTEIQRERIRARRPPSNLFQRPNVQHLKFRNCMSIGIAYVSFHTSFVLSSIRIIERSERSERSELRSRSVFVWRSGVKRTVVSVGAWVRERYISKTTEPIYKMFFLLECLSDVVVHLIF